MSKEHKEQNEKSPGITLGRLSKIFYRLNEIETQKHELETEKLTLLQELQNSGVVDFNKTWRQHARRTSTRS